MFYHDVMNRNYFTKAGKSYVCSLEVSFIEVSWVEIFSPLFQAS